MKKSFSSIMRTAAKIHHLMFLLQKNADTLLTKEVSLSFMQALILKIVSHHPHMSQKKLANCTNFTAGGVSRQVELLREKGLLTRKERKDNRREHTLSVTTKGKQEMEKAFTLLDGKLQKVFSALHKDECTQLEEYISKLIHVIDPDYYKFEAHKKN